MRSDASAPRLTAYMRRFAFMVPVPKCELARAPECGLPRWQPLSDPALCVPVFSFPFLSEGPRRRSTREECCLSRGAATIAPSVILHRL